MERTCEFAGRKVPFIILFSAFTATAYAQKQGQALIDSLILRLGTAKEDTNKVKLLNDLSEKAGWKVGQHDSAIHYAEQAVELAERLRYDRGLAQAHSNRGMALFQSGELKEAMAEHRASLAILVQNGDKARAGSSHGNIGHVYKSLGDYGQALRHYRLALEMTEAAGDPRSVATWYNHIGSVHSAQGDHPQAMESNLAALRIQETHGDSTGMTYSLNNIAQVHLKQRSYEEALSNSTKALGIMERSGDSKGLANSHNKLGNIHSAMGNYSKARAHYEEALGLYEELGDQKLIASSHGNIGVVNYQEGKLEEALQSQVLAMGIFERIGDQQGLANTYANIGSIHLDKGKPADAAKWYADGLAIAERIGSHYTAMQLCKGMMDAYTDLGDYRSALESHQRHIAFRDSLFNEDNARKLTRLEMQYDFDKKEAAEQAEQDKKDALAQQELRRQKLVRNGFIGGFLLVGMFAGVFLKQRIRIGREKHRSEELLLNILPEEIAEELKANGETAAVHIDQVTVLFTDFKGFTAMSEKVTPQQLVHDLHECFSAFDRICEKHGIEKIKTIGDAYMAAGGVPTPNGTHASDVINAALDMRDLIAEGNARKMADGSDYFEIRIGIHTGPVVAGIVGVKKFQYDIWGDTVNTASRMESSGEVGRVNISEATYGFVNDLKDGPQLAGGGSQLASRTTDNAELPGKKAFTFTPRGKVQAKGKGEMHMYFVDRALPST
ncbi:MAG: tetratricopeptide repeat protein [Flavobacteriales bacterium]|nr:tetratricopeptide repeat protein [Flavobacteriales bacterium]